MYQVKTKAKNIKHLFDLYWSSDYFGMDDDYIVKPSEPDLPIYIADEPNFLILDYADDIPSKYEKVEWRDNAKVIIEFEDEESALYFKLKYGQ